MYLCVEAGGDASKSQSDVCRSDTYAVIDIVCKCRGMSFVLVMINSSFSSTWMDVSDEDDPTCPVTGVSSGSSSFVGWWWETLGDSPSCGIGQLATEQVSHETHIHLLVRVR